MKILEKFKAI
jgi:hypothetical protein